MKASLVTEGTHHMNVLIGEFSFLDAFVGEGASEGALGATLGQHPCSELDTMELAYPIFPSQRENQQIKMPPGVAAPLGPCGVGPRMTPVAYRRGPLSAAGWRPGRAARGSA